jgi:alpha-beta hydrolase superfamily lysophospholipase
MAHGFGGLKHHGLVPFAECFARAGFTVIVHDHRGFGLRRVMGVGLLVAEADAEQRVGGDGGGRFW